MKKQMRRLANSQTNRFSGISGGIGAAPVPIADIAVLVPVQLLLIGIIGGLSCREFNTKTVTDYVTAMGPTVAAGFGLREGARALVQFIPGAGAVISAGIAAAGTWAIGKSAEIYFFDDRIKKPSEFMKEYKESRTRAKTVS